MACYHPIPATQSSRGGPVTLGPPLGTATLALPCGKCVGCKTDRATTWARRCTHEATLHKSSEFLTLTYDDEHLPALNHLVPKHLTDFIKRLRKNTGQNLRYLACGEYGENTLRPHYHAAIFGLDVPDRVRITQTLYTSVLLEKIWKRGHVRTAPFTPAAAAYIAQYSLKKQRHETIDEGGVVRPHPFIRMSLRPAIGKQWLEKYAKDLQHGYLITDGHRGPVPRYYKKWLKENEPNIWEMFEQKVQENLMKTQTDRNNPERQQAAEQIHKQKKERQKRELKAT